MTLEPFRHLEEPSPIKGSLGLLLVLLRDKLLHQGLKIRQLDKDSLHAEALYQELLPLVRP